MAKMSGKINKTKKTGQNKKIKLRWIDWRKEKGKKQAGCEEAKWMSGAKHMHASAHTRTNQYKVLDIYINTCSVWEQKMGWYIFI